MSTTIRNESEKINIDQIIRANVPLRMHSTYRTGGAADYLAEPGHLDELREALRWAEEKNLPVTILAGGSNVLISDKGVEGLVILLTGLNRHHIRGVLCVAHSGLPLDTAINVAIEHNLSGLEPLGGLPGSIGGAVWGNAGVREVSIMDFVEWVDYVDYGGNLFRYYPFKADRQYRASFFSGKECVLYEVALRLIPNKNSSEARLAKEESRNIRLRKGQFDLPSAGCMFKNPPGESAGRLIEKTGLKQMNYHGAIVSANHANFILKSSQDTTSADIYALSEMVREKIEKETSISLEREVQLIGRW
ncbi:MAG: UDP-N-acetylmuramate dehydrogenase [Sphaerochaetaceae bacterium]